jgi:hydrogenase-4 component E
VVTLMVIHLFASILAAEWRNFRSATYALIVQSLTLTLLLALYGLFWEQPWVVVWAGCALLTKALLIPYLLFRAMRTLPVEEVEPFLGPRSSLALVLLLTVVFFQWFHTSVNEIAPTVASMSEPAKSSLALAFTVFVLGLWVCTTRRDVVKVAIGLLLLENGAHLALVTLAPSLPQTAALGIFTNIVVVVWLLLHLGEVIYRALGTTDTAQLSALRR